MKAGIVCEYNPLHNGHLYHMDMTEKAGADSIICVMSGNFVQRGECACVDKWKRAEATIKCGANLVLDLPVPWAMGSAESFARGSISLLSHFNIDILSFGSETENEELLHFCAKISEYEDVGELLKKYVSQGDNYPAALTKAVAELFGDKRAEAISSPNSTLAVEYIKQLYKYAPDCKILPIKRVAVGHDSKSINDGFASASRIRQLIGNDNLSEFIPPFMEKAITEGIADGTVPYKTDHAERAVLSELRQMKREEYSLYVTDESGLSDRIYNSVKTAVNLNELCEFSKSKNYTHSRVRREVMNLYLRIPKEFHRYEPPYIRILAADEKGLSLLKGVRNIPLVTKHSDAQNLDSFGKEVYSLQCSSTDKFALMSRKIGYCGMEQKKSLIIVK